MYTTNVDGPVTLDVPVGMPVDVDGVKVRYFEARQRRVYWSPQMRNALRDSVQGFDIAHSHAVYLWPGVATAHAARAAQVPFMISPRGMLVPELIARKSRVAKTLWLKFVERRAFAGAAAIHFTSQLEWDEAKRVGMPLPSPFVVPNGIDLNPRPEVPREARTLLFLGRVSWKKGLDRVIEALPALNARLIIAGNDEEGLTPKLRAQAARAGADVEYVGPVYGRAKDELLARATLFVLLSMSENFGNTVLEALAMETPVVLSREVGLAGEVASANAGVIGLDEVAALLDDPQRRAVMGRNGRALVESRFPWARVAEEMEEAYCSIRSRR